MENAEENSEISKKSRLNCEMIWKIWKKIKLNTEKIWKYGRKQGKYRRKVS